MGLVLGCFFGQIYLDLGLNQSTIILDQDFFGN